MRFGSLFTGIGGLDLGLERAGMTCAWQVEVDPWCRKVLTKHWPDVPKFEDVRDVGAANLAPVDLIAGGFPCQPVSLAGKKRAQADERWLWPEFARIVRELRPRFVFVENVPGLLVRGFGDVLRDLSALGYDAEWETLPAAAFGAPHLRFRVGIVAYSRHDEPARQSLRLTHGEVPPEPSGDGEERDVADANGNRRPARGIHLRSGGQDKAAGVTPRARPTLADPERDGRQGAEHAGTRKRAPRNGRRPANAGDAGDAPHPDSESQERPPEPREECNPWATEPDVGRVAHGVPSRVDRLRGLGNAVVPQWAEWFGRMILATPDSLETQPRTTHEQEER